MARRIEPSQENPFIEIGRLISEESYKRERKEIRLENIVIDILRRGHEQVIIGEVKKSSRYEKSAMMQLAFYLSKIKEMGVKAKGELLFPKEKKKLEVELTSEIENELKDVENNILKIINTELPPKAEKNRFCKNCGYNEFCWS